MRNTCIVAIALLGGVVQGCETGKEIDRLSLVRRHNVKVTSFDPRASLSVGNGEFAFTVDATGLQTFPELYDAGVPLGTQSQWGWHSFPNTEGYRFEESLRVYDFGRGHLESYPVQLRAPAHAARAVEYFRVNPHRLHLGYVGLELLQKDGAAAAPGDISGIEEEIDLWSGTVRSSFLFDGERVEVTTVAHPEVDGISTRVASALVAKGQLKIRFTFPYPTGKHSDAASDWSKPERHQTALVAGDDGRATLSRTLDSTRYQVNVVSNGTLEASAGGDHYFILTPRPGASAIEMSCSFTLPAREVILPGFEETESSSAAHWQDFWMSGGAIDFSGTDDPRAFELERRVVLSQYLTAIQCAGSAPPQETGLTYNSWFGKFHMEMIWWHQVHFALWNRAELIKPSMEWYKGRAFQEARKTAERQGFKGVRWMKMTDPSGQESPSSVGSLLIWEQPHAIYFAELLYRRFGDEALREYQDLVFATAEFMADFAMYEKDRDVYSLNHVNGAQETLKPDNSHNPPFEVSYWHWGLKTAQEWRARLGLERVALWDEIAAKLPPFAERDGLYLAAESLPDTYTNKQYMSDHPMVLGAYGFLPPVDRLVNKETMTRTFLFIHENWFWGDTWGWDYPLAAMSATRLGLPDKAVDLLLMEEQKNTYLPNGHNYQDDRLRVYLPGNGGLLTAVAMMCAGYDGCTEREPGIPKDWKVKWEGLVRMP
ncbi:MAG: hypothetical protein LBI96_03565 [Odoribacteraceae bacterium]|jgi:hypothetical protein|nr:hypothetical protein [Odoribacteraceae bacterium]